MSTTDNSNIVCFEESQQHWSPKKHNAFKKMSIIKYTL